MILSITANRPATSEEWDRIWGNCDYATYFHSREWAEIWEKYTHGAMRPNAKLITFSDGTSALLTLSSRNIFKGIIKQHFLSPAGTYGGWLSVDELSAEHGSLLHKYISTHCKVLTWRLNPYNPLEIHQNTKEIRNDETHVLDLEGGFDAIYRGWTKGHASAARKARKARKAGIEIREALTLQDWQDYYRVYEDSLKRWGKSASSHYKWQFFKIMFDLSSPHIKLWLATLDKQTVAGALCFYAKKHVSYWHGSAFSEYFNLRPVNLLMYESIKNSCENDYRWFDFNPSGEHEGVKAFKKSFGTQELMCPVLNNDYKVNRLAHGVKSRIKQMIS